MSIAVELERVQSEAQERGPGGFLLTVTDDGRPHVVAVTIGWDDGSLIMDAGRSSAGNATGRPDVTLLWPPAEPGGYSLIVDGVATVEPTDDGGRVQIQPTRAVLHRPGPGGSGPGCTADCIPLFRS